jgi:hypothetical protein
MSSPKSTTPSPRRASACRAGPATRMRGIMHDAEQVLLIRHDDDLMFPRAHTKKLNLVFFRVNCVRITVLLARRTSSIRVALMSGVPPSRLRLMGTAVLLRDRSRQRDTQR